MKPVPVTVVVKTPSGSGVVPVAVTVGVTFVWSVTVALDCPAELMAVTVSVPDAGMAEGAV